MVEKPSHLFLLVQQFSVEGEVALPNSVLQRFAVCFPELLAVGEEL